MENPSIKLIENIRKQGAYFNVQEIFFGKVISPSPLKVKFKDIIVDNLAVTQSFIDLGIAYKHFDKVFLKAGDIVLIVYFQDIDKYVVVDKVVM